MTLSFRPTGVCASRMDIEIEDGLISAIEVQGGCDGNLQGISSLVVGMPAETVISKLNGIDCNGKGTSCPDQLAKALAKALS